MNYPIVTMVLGASIFALGGYFKIWPSNAAPTVANLFSEIYTRTPTLGKPLANAQISSKVYFGVFERGLVIWTLSASTHYVLPNDQDGRKVSISSLSEVPVHDSIYYDEEKIRSKLSIPEGKRPPTGGVALEWDRNPLQWQWLGGRQWQVYSEGEISVQYFENGMAIGPLPYSADYLNSGWRVFAIISDGRSWTQKSTSAKLASAQTTP